MRYDCWLMVGTFTLLGCNGSATATDGGTSPDGPATGTALAPVGFFFSTPFP
jgi:hypothetical protein